MNIKKVILCGLSVLVLQSTGARAEENMKFHGTLVDAPDCVINGGQPIKVEFGNVSIGKIDGVNYAEEIKYNLSCEGGDGKQMALSITGQTDSEEGDGVLETDKRFLGLQLMNEQSKLAVGGSVTFTYPTFPVLKVVPVKASHDPTVGEFNASATMVIAWP